MGNEKKSENLVKIQASVQRPLQKLIFDSRSQNRNKSRYQNFLVLCNVSWFSNLWLIIDIAMRIYNLMEYSNNDAKKWGNLWQYHKDISNDNTGSSDLFKFKQIITEKVPIIPKQIMLKRWLIFWEFLIFLWLVTKFPANLVSEFYNHQFNSSRYIRNNECNIFQ